MVQQEKLIGALRQQLAVSEAKSKAREEEFVQNYADELALIDSYHSQEVKSLHRMLEVSTKDIESFKELATEGTLNLTSLSLGLQNTETTKAYTICHDVLLQLGVTIPEIFSYKETIKMIEETKQLMENMTDSDSLSVKEVQSKILFG